MNSDLSDIANEMTNSLAADGQTTPTGNLKMGGRKHINVGNADARNEYGAIGQLQDGQPYYDGLAGGTPDAITTNPSPNITVYVEGMPWIFQASATNTGAVTIKRGGAPTIALEIDGAALVGGEIESGKFYTCIYDGVAAQANRLSELTELVKDTSPELGGVLNTNGYQIRESLGSIVPVASTLTIPDDGNYFFLSGSGTVTGISGTRNGTHIALVLGGATTFEDGPNLIVLGNADLTGLSGDVVEFRQDGGTPIWRMTNYSRANGEAVVGGRLVDDQYAENGTYETTTTEIPRDDTIPQQTEGAEALTVSITPKAAGNILQVEAGGVFGLVSGASNVNLALFQDATAAAIGASAVFLSVSASLASGEVKARVTAASTSETTFKLRFGAADGTSEVARNGDDTSRIFGGTAKTYIRVTEITP